MAMLGSYMQMIDPKYVVTAVVLNIFSALIIASVINPYKNDNKELEAESEKILKTTFFQMIGESAIDGFRIAITVAIMLLAFISLMKGITIVFDLVGLDFKN